MPVGDSQEIFPLGRVHHLRDIGNLENPDRLNQESRNREQFLVQSNLIFPDNAPVNTPPRQNKLRSRRFRFARFVLIWGAVAGCCFTVLVVGAVTIYALMAEDPLKAGLSKKPAKLSIMAADGRVIAEKGLRRVHVPIERLPDHLKQAVLVTEDRRFYHHFGFDPIGITRAMIANRRAGRIVQGGSTITQQLVKVLFLKPRRTYARKIEEILLSLSLEYRLDKDQILELYLNRIYFGSGNFGIEAATQYYFGKSVFEIGPYESAILAGLIKSPSYFAPTRNFDRALERGRTVLNKMRDSGLISDAAYEKAIANPPKLRTYLPARSYGYVIDWVVSLMPDLGYNNEDDLTVETTIDYELQGAVQKIVSMKMAEHGKAFNAGEAAAVILDRFGGVKALVGGRDYNNNQFNRVVQARRQPGSTFKPFVYLSALERGLTPDHLVFDGPIQIGNWSPRNYNNRYYGDVTLRRALSSSLNTAAVRLSQWVGPEAVAKTAHKLGISSQLKIHPSIALGTSEVTLLELTSAYVPFANGGIAVQPHIIRTVKNSKGEFIFNMKSSSLGRVVPRHLVSAMNDMLSATILEGTGKKASIPPHPIAGKTGTGQSYRDAWFVGYSAHYITGVWIGNDDFKPMKRVTGGSLPTFIWKDLMELSHIGKPVVPLPGHDWQLARTAQAYQKKSFWDMLFNPSSSRDPMLSGSGNSPATLSRGVPHKRLRRWREQVFSSD